MFSSEGSKSIHAGSRLPLWGIGMDNLNATLNGAMHNLMPAKGHVWTAPISPLSSPAQGGKAIKPITAVAAISTGLLTFQRKKTARDSTPIRAVSKLPMAMFPSKMHAH